MRLGGWGCGGGGSRSRSLMVSWYRIRGAGIAKRLEAAWIAIIAAVIGVIGVVAGGFLTLIGGRFQSQDADRRLKTQLEHEAIQRRED